MAFMTTSRVEVVYCRAHSVRQSDSTEQAFARQLYEAVVNGDLQTTAHILRSDHVRVNDSLDDTGMTALHTAVWHGRWEVVEQLLAGGANLEIENEQKHTPLETAIQLLQEEGIKRLLASGAQIRGRAECIGRLLGTDRYIVDYLQLLGQKVEGGEQQRTGWTAMHVAALHKSKSDVELFLSMGLDLGVKSLLEVRVPIFDELPVASSDIRYHVFPAGSTPIDVGLKVGFDVVGTLKGKPSTLQPYARQPSRPKDLCNAAREANVDEVLLLLNYGVHVDAIGPNSEAPLHVATRLRHREVVAVLLNHNALVDRLDGKNQTALHVAAQTGDKDIAALLVAKKALINVVDSRDRTPLHCACRSGSEAVTKLLLEQNADVSGVDAVDQRSVLHVASAVGHAGIVNLLLHGQAAGLVEQVDRHQCRPLHLAAANGHAQVVEDLVKHGADIASTEATEQTPLHFACAGGHVGVVVLLTQAGATLDARDAKQRTPLHVACLKGRLEVVAKLLDSGADALLVDGRGSSPSHLAASNGHTCVLRLLLSTNSAEVDATDAALRTPLHVACHGGHVDAAQLLLSCGATAGAADEKGQTPLHVTCIRGCVELVQALMKHDAGSHVADAAGHTPLHLACIHGHVPVVQLLIATPGVELGTVDRHGNTPLHYASGQGHTCVVELLVYHGAPVGVANCALQTALHRASGNGHNDVVSMLLEASARVNARDQFGCSPLHVAAGKGHMTCSKLLLEDGASVSCRDNRGRTPLMAAASMGFTDMARMMLDVCQGRELLLFKEACQVGSMPTVALILDKLTRHKSISHVANGSTPLTLAAQYTPAHLLGTCVRQVVKARQNMGDPVDWGSYEGVVATHFRAIRAPHHLRMDIDDGAPLKALVESVQWPDSGGGKKATSAVVALSSTYHAALANAGACSEEAACHVLHVLMVNGCSVEHVEDIVALFGNDNVDLGTQMGGGRTLLMCATCLGSRSWTSRLLADSDVVVGVNAVDANGMTALMYAAAKNHVGCVAQLLQVAAVEPNCVGNGKTALELALEKGAMEAAYALWTEPPRNKTQVIHTEPPSRQLCLGDLLLTLSGYLLGRAHIRPFSTPTLSSSQHAESPTPRDLAPGGIKDLYQHLCAGDLCSADQAFVFVHQAIERHNNQLQTRRSGRVAAGQGQEFVTRMMATLQVLRHSGQAWEPRQNAFSGSGEIKGKVQHVGWVPHAIARLQYNIARRIAYPDAQIDLSEGLPDEVCSLLSKCGLGGEDCGVLDGWEREAAAKAALDVDQRHPQAGEELSVSGHSENCASPSSTQAECKLQQTAAAETPDAQPTEGLPLKLELARVIAQVLAACVIAVEQVVACHMSKGGAWEDDTPATRMESNVEKDGCSMDAPLMDCTVDVSKATDDEDHQIVIRLFTTDAKQAGDGESRRLLGQLVVDPELPIRLSTLVKLGYGCCLHPIQAFSLASAAVYQLHQHLGGFRCTGEYRCLLNGEVQGDNMWHTHETVDVVDVLPMARGQPAKWELHADIPCLRTLVVSSKEPMVIEHMLGAHLAGRLQTKFPQLCSPEAFCFHPEGLMYSSQFREAVWLAEHVPEESIPIRALPPGTKVNVAYGGTLHTFHDRDYAGEWHPVCNIAGYNHTMDFFGHTPYEGNLFVEEKLVDRKVRHVLSLEPDLQSVSNRYIYAGNVDELYGQVQQAYVSQELDSVDELVRRLYGLDDAEVQTTVSAWLRSLSSVVQLVFYNERGQDVEVPWLPSLKSRNAYHAQQSRRLVAYRPRDCRGREIERLDFKLGGVHRSLLTRLPFQESIPVRSCWRDRQIPVTAVVQLNRYVVWKVSLCYEQYEQQHEFTITRVRCEGLEDASEVSADGYSRQHGFRDQTVEPGTVQEVYCNFLDGNDNGYFLWMGR